MLRLFMVGRVLRTLLVTLACVCTAAEPGEPPSAEQLATITFGEVLAGIDKGKIENNFFDGGPRFASETGTEFDGNNPTAYQIGACVLDKGLGVAEVMKQGRDKLNHGELTDLLIDIPACCWKGTHREACVRALEPGFDMIRDTYAQTRSIDDAKREEEALARALPEAFKTLVKAGERLAQESGESMNSETLGFVSHAHSCNDLESCAEAVSASAADREGELRL